MSLVRAANASSTTARGEPYLPVLEALAELCRIDSTRAVPCCARWRRPGCCSCRGSARAEERDALRRELAGVSPDRMLREMGELLDRYSRAPAAVAGDRGPALERPRDDPAHRLHRATARQRAPHVARKLSSRRGRRARSSAQPVAARAAPARAVRGDRARSVLRKPRSRTTWRNDRQSIANDEAFVRALHERTDGLPLFVASVMSEMSARAAQGGGRVAPAQAGENRRSRESGGDHRALHRQARERTAHCCSRRPPFAASSSASTRSRPRSSGTPPGLARSATSSRASSCGSSPRVPRKAATTQSRRIRSGMRCSAKCCTSARRHRRGHSSTAKSAPPSNESAPQACRSPPPSWRRISSEAASATTARALLRRSRRSRARRTSAPKSA